MMATCSASSAMSKNLLFDEGCNPEDGFYYLNVLRLVFAKLHFFSETANDYGKKFVILHAVMEKEATRPLILISNDDGYAAKGINDLIEMVRPMGDVLVCAPDGPRSGQACAFSATVPLTLTQRRKENGVEVWSCNGSKSASTRWSHSE